MGKCRQTLVNLVITLIWISNSFMLCESSMCVLDMSYIGLDTLGNSFTSYMHFWMCVGAQHLVRFLKESGYIGEL